MIARSMILAAVSLTAISLAAAPTRAQVVGNLNEMAASPIVTIHAAETVNARPDTATIHAGVTSHAPTASQALAENSAKMERVVAALRSAGIPAPKIQTSGINLNPRHSQERGVENRIIGYEARNTVRVATDDLAGLGKLLDSLVAAGGTNISGPYFSIAKPAAMQREAKRRALADADGEAQFYAQARGYSTARLIAIEEGPRHHGGDIIVTGSRISNASVQAPPPPIEPGEVAVGANLTVRYILVK